MQFACASALAMLVEGEPEMCPQVLRHGGVAALTIMLQTAGAQGRKAAAEALQVDCRCPSGHTCTAVHLWSARHMHHGIELHSSDGSIPSSM